MKWAKFFMIFVYCFCFFILLIGTIGNIIDGNYVNIIILFVVVATLVIFSIFLFRFIFNFISHIKMSIDSIQFTLFNNKILNISKSEITNIYITSGYYIFVFKNGKKLFYQRYSSIFDVILLRKPKTLIDINDITFPNTDIISKHK